MFKPGDVVRYGDNGVAIVSDEGVEDNLVMFQAWGSDLVPVSNWVLRWHGGGCMPVRACRLHENPDAILAAYAQAVLMGDV